jgi:small subunit ribosomal protein S20
MPVTKSAKRALRGSKTKQSINKLIVSKLESAIRSARKSKTSAKIMVATSLADKAAKKRVIHKNKAARMKSQLSKLLLKKSENRKTQTTRRTGKPVSQKGN